MRGVHVVQAAQQAAQLGLLGGRQGLVDARNVSTAYYEALLRETQLGFVRADHQRAAATYQDLAARQRAGRALVTDVSTAQINLRTAALALDLAQKNIVLSKQNLLATLGLPPRPGRRPTADRPAGSLAQQPRRHQRLGGG